jgi:membrane protein
MGATRDAATKSVAAGGNAPVPQPPARMLDVVKQPKALWTLVKDSVTAWIEDFAPSMGAAISYYTVFSIAPLLLIVISVAGLVLGSEAASGKIFAQLEGMLGPEGAAAIQGMVKSASSDGKGTIGTIVGIVTVLIGATTVFNELQSALDRIWRAPAAAKKEGIWSLIRARFLSFGMILAIGFLLLVSLIASAALSAFGEWYGGFFAGWEILLQVVNFVVSVGIVTVLFALIYKYMPRVDIGWHDVWIGAAVTAVLFTIGKSLIGLYIGKSGVVSGFGAAGSLVIVLLWVYYSSQIFLLGAEFTWHYAYQFGSKRGLEPNPAISGKNEGDAAREIPAANDDSAGEGAGARRKGAKAALGPRRTLRPDELEREKRSLASRLQPKTAGTIAKATGYVAAAFTVGAIAEVIARRLGAFGPEAQAKSILKRQRA